MISSRTMILKQDQIILNGFFSVIPIGLKEFATLLPKNWLAETPQALASRRLGRQSAERERISESDWMFLNKKLQSNSLFFFSLKQAIRLVSCSQKGFGMVSSRTMILKQDQISLMAFSCNPHWIEEICDTPAEKLASRDPTGACVEEARETVGGKGADF
ncbi:hypothetical protein V2I71_15345 [Peribacillus frigoritolerans]|uniref:hypothetical protein n=1 Tax=Peribacillus frigoritolerans TaxID=450367 RepID=UPI002ED292DC|nr:hypothetical protein V2I71_15345 [Peribacillus frigoritolerans]